VHLETPCNQKCAGCRPCRGAMEPRADIPRPSAIGQSRAQQKEPLQTQLIPPALGSRRACNRCLTICARWCQSTASWQPHYQRHGGRPGLWNADQARTAIPQRAKKQLFGLELDQCFRFAVLHFGIKTSGNAFHALLSQLIKHWQMTYDVRIILWIDDICVIVPDICTEQDTCGGADN